MCIQPSDPRKPRQYYPLLRRDRQYGGLCFADNIRNAVADPPAAIPSCKSVPISRLQANDAGEATLSE
jgi:hypothetical protein